ncbi:MAG: hypothetical protein ACE5GQ_08580, partial [Nitrospinales bacterium]
MIRIPIHKARKRLLAVPASLLLIFAVSLFSVPALAGDLETAMQELGSKSRMTIKRAAAKLGNIGDISALPALEALRSKRLRVEENGRLIILNEKGDAGVDAVTGKPVDLLNLELRAPRINNAVRRALATAIAKLKLKSEDADIRLAAAENLLKR